MSFKNYLYKKILAAAAAMAMVFTAPRVCHLQKNILKVEQRIYVICLTFFAEYDIIDV